MEAEQGGETKVYLLAAWSAASDLAQQVEDWRSHITRWQISLSDPLPPYHFV